MSGGSFGYAFFRIDDLLDQLEHKINNNSGNDPDKYYPNFSEDTIDNLKKSGQFLQLCSQLAKDIEWLYSGDDGEETFNGNCEETFKQMKKFREDE